VNRLLYRIIQVAVILCFYLVPYLLLAEVKGFELFATWIGLTVIAGVTSLFELWKKR
jgi:hypothetical protein